MEILQPYLECMESEYFEYRTISFSATLISSPFRTPSGMGGTFYFQTEQYKTDLIDFKVKYKNKDLDYDDYYLWHFIYTFSDPGTQIRLNV